MPNPSPAPQPVDPEHVDPARIDPVRDRRRQIARWNRLASRSGYLLLLAAMAVFAIALATGFTDTMATIIIACLIVGCVLLAPAIIIGYAVKAAERDDRERGL
jgi:hypothetical protein